MIFATLVTDSASSHDFCQYRFHSSSPVTDEEDIHRKEARRSSFAARNSCDRFPKALSREGLRDLLPFEVKVKNYRKDTSEEYIAGIYVLPVRDSDKPGETYFVALERELETSRGRESSPTPDSPRPSRTVIEYGDRSQRTEKPLT